jgi:hypothetical protein
MDIENIDTEIEWCELQLKLATDDDAINEYGNELSKLRFKKHLNLLIQKANNIKCKRTAQEQPLPHIPFRY